MKWISIKDQDPPILEEVLVCKYYLDGEWDFENGGYTEKEFEIGPYVVIDMLEGWTNHHWKRGGYVKHWMRIPKPPKD